MIRDRYYNKGMELEEYKTYVKQGRTIRAGSPEHLFMHSAAERARQYTAQMNAGSPSQETLQELFFTLTGQPKEESFHIFPPFYTDFGQNIVVGKDVFINEGCSFQDQGGIVIGDGCLIGHQVVLATLNHVQDPAHRADMIPAPILLGKKRLDRRARHHPCRGDGGGQFHRRGGRRGHQGRSRKYRRGRRSRLRHQKNTETGG